MENRKTTIAMVDDHPLFRQGLRALLEQEPDPCVVGEADDARRAYSIVEAKQPDVIVLDISLPGVDGVVATRELQRRAPGSKILILTMHEEPALASRALAAGAVGYAVKSEPPASVLRAVRSTSRGERFVTDNLSGASVTDDETGANALLSALSQREREVFHLLVRGFSNHRVAKELCISVKTVETHRTHIHHKLGVHSVAELLRLAARHGLLPV
jgi:DNA-binding NarL/FixJ family response regulator